MARKRSQAGTRQRPGSASVRVDNRPPTKAERRDQARQERMALQRKMERRRRITRWAVTAGVVLAGLGVAVGILVATRSESPKNGPVYVTGAPSVDPASLAGILTGPAPWPANATQMGARLAPLGLQPLTAEGTVVHVHQHIDIYIDGTKEPIPAQIGIVTQPQVLFSPIHTHDASGIIHVESPIIRDFTLGEFFDVWGVRFTNTCIGGYCNQGDKTLRVYVDGQLATGDVTQLKLFSHEEIVVAYGTSAELPTRIPASYTFPVGL
jgi:hypothetical protein